MFAAKIPMFAAEITVSPRENLAAETLENFGALLDFQFALAGRRWLKVSYLLQLWDSIGYEIIFKQMWLYP